MSGPSQHRRLPPERWAGFSFDQQILAIGNELNRTLAMLEAAEWQRAHLSYERMLTLVDLTVAVQSSRTRRRELLRWRDLVAALYVQPEPDVAEHRRIFRTLLQLTPVASRQIEPLLGRVAG